MRRRTRMSAAPAAALLAVFLSAGCERRPEPPADYRQALREQLVGKVLPYWYDTSIDGENGGYLLGHDPSSDLKATGVKATEKMLVSQARMVWAFSHAHLKKLGDGTRDYLEAAGNGYRFLLEHFLDGENGGYYWMTDLEGNPTNDRKYLYANSFVVYALVEYHRASGDAEPLGRAMELYETVQEKWHDPDEGGWFEEGERDFSPVRGELDMGYARHKSANAHLHWMEALTELYDVTRDRATGEERVRKSLEEALDINMKYFFPLPAEKACYYRRPDWSEVPERPGLSYGHNVEFAWLMVRAERVLGREPPLSLPATAGLSWDHFDAELEHALRCGYDHERGGLYHTGTGAEPASDTRKIWWPQAEMLAALVVGLGDRGPSHRPNPEYSRALDSQLSWLWRYQIDHADGIWHDTVAPDGRVTGPAKSHVWKAAYHDVRALVKFLEFKDSTTTNTTETRRH